MLLLNTLVVGNFFQIIAVLLIKDGHGIMTTVSMGCNYRLREQAVANLTHANDLVQRIAVGRPPSSGK